MKHRTLAKCVMAVITAGSCVAMQQLPQSFSQSIVEAAKQRSSDRKAKRVYTEDDLPAQPASTQPNAHPGSQQEQGDNGVKSVLSDEANAEAKPETQVGKAEKVVEARKIQIETMTEEKNRLEQRLKQPGTSADEYSAISESIRGIDKKIGDWQKQLDDAQKVVDAAKQPKPPSDAQVQ